MAKNLEEAPITLTARIEKIIPGEDQTKAFASVQIGDAFVVHDIRITDKDNKITIGMPFRSYQSGGETKYTDTFHAISANARAYLVAAVSQAYEQALEQQMAELEREEPEEGFGMSQQM